MFTLSPYSRFYFILRHDHYRSSKTKCTDDKGYTQNIKLDGGCASPNHSFINIQIYLMSIPAAYACFPS